MQHDRDEAAVRDMLNAARDAVTFIADTTNVRFAADRKTQSAVAYRLLVVGEAVSRVSSTFRELHPDIPWQQAKAMRNLIVHEYDYIRADIVWATLQTSIPELITQLETLLSDS